MIKGCLRELNQNGTTIFITRTSIDVAESLPPRGVTTNGQSPRSKREKMKAAIEGRRSVEVW